MLSDLEHLKCIAKYPLQNYLNEQQGIHKLQYCWNLNQSITSLELCFNS